MSGNNRIRASWIMSSASFVALVTAGPALGQSASTPAANAPRPAPAPAAAAAAAPQPASTLGDIVVTARRRSESLQNVPISVTAFSGAALAQARIATSQDLAGHVPSLVVAPTGITRNAESFTIRGQGATFGASPGVVTYFSEVPLPQNNYTGAQGGTPMFYDLNNLQVLKGPQGTLFGRNTTGGAVLVEPKHPTNNLGGYAQVQLGNLADREAQAAINVPVIDDRLLVRIAGDYEKRAGFTHDLTSGERLDNRNKYGGRIGVTWKPTDTIENYFVGYYSYSRDNGTGTVLSGVNPTVLNAIFAGIGGCAGLGSPDCFQSVVDAQNARGPRHVALSTLPYDRTVAGGLADTLSWKLGDTLNLRNIFSFSRLRDTYRVDYDGSPLQLDDIATPKNVESTDGQVITEELQLQGTSVDKRLTYVIGGYYERDKPVGPQSQTGIVFFTPSTSSSFEKRESKALYGQFTYDLGGIIPALDNLKFTGGVRYTHDTQQGFSDYIFDKVTSGSSKVPTWTAGLDYRLSRHVLIYGKASRGYKQGGFSALAVDPLHATFEPEYVTTFEGGAKTDFRVFGRPARVNADYYYSKYTDIQRTGGDSNVIGGQTVAGSATYNAGRAHIQGVEVEATIAPFDGFELSANYSYTDAKYDSYQLAISQPQLDCGGLVSPFALPGARVSPTANLACIPFQFAPKHQGSATATYTLPLRAEAGKLSISANVSYMDKIYAAPTAVPVAEPFATLGSYTLLGFNVDWNGVMGRPFDLSFFMKNATNKTYRISNYAVYSQLGFTQDIYGEPRTFGFRLRYHFGQD
jgi:iron complex outermembrane receptor protein